MLKSFVLSTLFGLAIGTNIHSQNKEYVEKYKDIAILQMHEHKIPASITLAQGILESGSGLSRLAVKGNNHFGIKCTDWNGPRMYKDDDKKGECFRVYAKAEDSFEDHSNFLLTRERYSSLFQLEVTDYKAWAKGLKKAGYATDPNYPVRLINIIEELELYKYDAPQNDAKKEKSVKKEAVNDSKEPIKKSKVEPTVKPKNAQGRLHTVKTQSNRTKYIVAKEGDTFYRISQEFKMALWELRKYNDLGTEKDILEPGDIVYLTPKKSKGVTSKVKVDDSTTELWKISQEEGVKLRTIEKKNPDLSVTEKIPIGTQVKLK